MGLVEVLTRIFRPLSFAEIRELNRATGFELSKDEARRRIDSHSLFAAPEVGDLRDALLACLSEPTAPEARSTCDALVRQAIERTKLLVRPGTVEELWVLDGLFDRVLERP